MELEHMSFSALSRYEECPRSFYLGRVKRAEEKQTWFFPLGTAVHVSVEDFLRDGEVPAFEDVFYPLIEKQMKIDPDDVNWLAGGPRDDPIIRDKAVELGKRCVENAVKFLDDIDVWEVEYDASGMIAGCEVPIKAFIDIVGEHKKHGPAIVDWKSGKTKPKTNLQLETYAVLLNSTDHPFNEHKAIQFDTGLWAMVNPDAPNARPVKGLTEVDASALGARYQAAYEKVKERKWQANAGYHCRFCTMAPNCLIESPGTQRATYYDKSDEDGYPF
ncbi:Cas4 family exonuclease [Streptomyces phage Olicious]|uniref:Cas4 family exonuclease n=4 Tax=Immanueltrevirus immanuel3 TaxID=2846399 RepID=A0A2H5BM11_9CAUD|nr:Cas4 family exonuclease [Streptomyces phage HaugeAnator]AUG87498.1 Cas4 family exonuclease [Streptomyces phage Romero]AUG87627.1 Cas4 family exonuclease [Streptomyces phage ZooBear]AZF95853.1 Cas4 family exonuclease [Streptomyces phage Olicious]